MKTLVIEATNIKAGGGFIHLIELIANADFALYDFTKVIVCAPKTTLIKIVNREEVTKYNHPWFEGNQWQRFMWQRVILKKLLRDNNALLFIPGAGKPYFAYPFVTMARNLLPIDLHELSRYRYTKDWLRYKLLRYLHFRSYISAEGLICMNKYTFKAMPESIQSKVKKLAIIPHGLNPLFKTNRKTSYKLSKPVKLIYVSRLNLYKHQWHVAKAVYLLAEKGHNVTLSLIGGMKGYGRQLLERVIAENETRFPGIIKLEDDVSYESLPAIYQSADLFIFASSCETFGMILLEAMGAALPIACSNKSSMKEMLLNAGVYFDPENPSEICDALIQMLNEENLRSQSGERAHTISLQYDWKKTADATLKFISDTLS